VADKMSLSAEKRAVIISRSDENPRTWSIFVDRGHSKHALLRRLAERLGAKVEEMEGGGIAFEVPNSRTMPGEVLMNGPTGGLVKQRIEKRTT